MNTEKKRKVILITLRSVAKQKGISDYEIARKTGIAQPNVIRMLSGDSSPGIDNVLKIAEAIGVDLFEIFINEIIKIKDEGRKKTS